MDLKDVCSVVNVNMCVSCLDHWHRSNTFFTECACFLTLTSIQDMFMMDGQGHVYALQVWLQLKGMGKDCVKMALKELGAQLARPISVRVATDDSQFSQPII